MSSTSVISLYCDIHAASDESMESIFWRATEMHKSCELWKYFFNKNLNKAPSKIYKHKSLISTNFTSSGYKNYWWLDSYKTSFNVFAFARLLTTMSELTEGLVLTVGLLLSNVFLLNFSKVNTSPLFQFRVHPCLHTRECNTCLKTSLLDSM